MLSIIILYTFTFGSTLKLVWFYLICLLIVNDYLTCFARWVLLNLLGEIENTTKLILYMRFEIISKYEPAGDQPLPRGVVRVEGTVVALPKTIRELSFYLNDVRGQGVPKNLRVDFAPTTRVALALGDRLRIQGKLNGTLEPYLRLAATSLIEHLDRAATLPTPTPLDNVISEESIGPS